jgi:hypothetical protein
MQTGDAMVVIQKQQQRSFWFYSAVNSIPDLLIAWAVAEYSDSGLLGFGAAWLGLQALYLLIWAKNSVWLWLSYWLYRKRRMVEGMEGQMASGNYPSPPKYLISHQC